MTTELLPRLDAAGAIGTAAPAAAPQAPDNASFRRLLESLEKLTKDHRQAPPAAAVAGSVGVEAGCAAGGGWTSAAVGGWSGGGGAV